MLPRFNFDEFLLQAEDCSNDMNTPRNSIHCHNGMNQGALPSCRGGLVKHVCSTFVMRPPLQCRAHLKESQDISPEQHVTRRSIISGLLASTAGSSIVYRAHSEEVTGSEDAEGITENVQIAEKATVSSQSSVQNLEPQGRERRISEFKTLHDDTLAYSFSYPVSTQGTKLPVIVSRRPERYSSAAPLAPDARQRIVSELVDFSHGLVISMTVGPPSGVLKGRPPADWKPKEVATTVLIDRSTARITEGQRVALQQVENARAQAQDGTTYWTYEHLSQGSPNLQNVSKETYRHAVAVTTWRPGLKGTPFLYTLNLSCPDERWEEYGELLCEAATTFRLVPTSKAYIPPDKDPWRFF